jgi:hypothetical protein
MSADEFAALAGPEFGAWLRQMERLAGCARPVYLVGHTLTRDRQSGELLHVFTSASQPYGRLAVACGNRREAVCLSCSYLHKGDTYQIVVSGLAGGKGVPEDVADRPRVFATFTAPSFGPVHRRTGFGSGVCRARRDAATCPHGVSVACFRQHGADDPQVGAPLCGRCYDYAGAVVWNASVGKLWRHTLIRIAREVGKAGGVRAGELNSAFRLGFAKVVEYQRRGLVHLHVVVRCDGPGGPGDPAPSWVSAAVLGAAVAAAAAAVMVTVPSLGGGGLIGWGPQLDVREIGAGGELNNSAVAAYVAKYVSKGDIAGLVLPHRLRSEGQIDATPGLSDHARHLMHACFTLAALPEFASLRLDRWAFQLGFRGHVATKSRRYSTTYAQLRADRAAFRGAVVLDPETTVTDRSWRLDGAGHTPAQALFALAIARTHRDRRAADPGGAA